MRIIAIIALWVMLAGLALGMWQVREYSAAKFHELMAKLAQRSK